jgi:hypothetical protein
VNADHFFVSLHAKSKEGPVDCTLKINRVKGAAPSQPRATLFNKLKAPYSWFYQRPLEQLNMKLAREFQQA